MVVSVDGLLTTRACKPLWDANAELFHDVNWRPISNQRSKEADAKLTKEVEKQLVADHCNYEEDGGNCARLHLRKLRRQECQSEDQRL